MAQPDDYGFSEEAALLKDSARKFFKSNFPTDKLHRMVADNPDSSRLPESHWDKELWQQLLELGWTLLAVPESADGLGMPAVAVVGLIEEAGRVAFPCPLLATLNATYVLAACGDSGNEALKEIAAGATATLALTNSAGSWQLQDTEVCAAKGKLNGTAWFVQDARKVDRLLVCAKKDKGHSLYWVASEAPGITVHADAIVDLTRDQAHVEFCDVEAKEVCEDGLNALEQAFPAIWTMLAADVIGAAEWQLQTTAEYARTRTQFDRPIGFFQAVKHPLVDVMIQIDEAKSLVYNAACAIDHEPERAAEFAHMAKASASETAAFASSRSVQFHGGIGYTWECFIQLYFKRQKHSQMLWGDAAWHRTQLADIVLGEVG
ncbi:MAG: alkylation response protein AidB-like acyl-CoA dehydrogenase [Pseudohongiellaceae bacterium]|jgi:alkylation response protein AidB-like acyl-CoA dehydrogenase